jgi:hypothetical protein
MEDEHLLVAGKSQSLRIGRLLGKRGGGKPQEGKKYGLS